MNETTRRIAAMAVGVFMIISGPLGAADNSPAHFYVSTVGKDTDAGTKDRPFATISRAQQAVRGLCRKGLTGDVTVHIRGGTYYLSEPLTFGPEDSGTREHRILYTAHSNERPILSGGRPVKAWRKKKADRWTVTLPDVRAGTWWFRQLFMEDRRLPRARFPNGDTLLTVASVSSDVKTIRFSDPIPGADLAGGDAELVMFQNWSISRGVIVSSSDRDVTLRDPMGWIGHGPATTASKGKPAYLEHAAAFLDEEGEWYLNRKTGELTLVLAAGQDPNRSRFVAPVLDQLLVVAGQPDAPVRNLTFRGLTFSHVAWNLPAFGYNGIQAGHYGTTMKQRTYVLPAAVHFSYAEQCALERCRIAHTGAGGIAVGIGSRRNRIDRCEVVDIGGNGVLVGWRGGSTDSPLAGDPGDPSLAADWKDPAHVPVGNEITNCVVQRCGAVNHGCVGIFDAFCAGTKIAHNHVADLPYTGISIGFRWDTSSTSQRNCVVEYNHIHDVMKMLADGGGIYTLGLQPGTVLRGNHIHDVHRSAFAHGGAPNNGIFFDQGSKGYAVEANVIYRTSGKPIRFNQTGKENMTWKDNSFGPEPEQPGFPQSVVKQAGPRSESRPN